MKKLGLIVDDINVRWIPGYDNDYAARIDGVIVSYRTSKPKLLSPTLTSNGYHRVKIVENGKNVSRRVHRLVAMAFHECLSFEDFEVDHRDMNKLNNSESNLRWCTGKENIDHYILHKYGADKIDRLNKKAELNAEINKLRTKIKKLIHERDLL